MVTAVQDKQGGQSLPVRCAVSDLFALPALTQRKLTPEGYLTAPARLARTGVQRYTASELGLDKTHGMDASQSVRLYRPHEEVFAPEAVASFEKKPVTINHPKVDVTSANWKQYAVGDVHGLVADGQYLSGTIIVRDAAAIAAIQDGKAELSNGYSFELDLTPGTSPDGEAYDGVQRRIQGNHVAAVDYGRAGAACRVADTHGGSFEVGDSVTSTADHMPGMKGAKGKIALVENGPYYGVKLEGFPGIHKWLAEDELSPGSSSATKSRSMSRMGDSNQTKETPMARKVIVDGIGIDLEETHAAIVEKTLTAKDAALKSATDASAALEARATKAEAAVTVANDAATKLVADHAAQVGKLTAQILTADAVEALVEERTQVVADASAFCADFAPKGKTVQAIRSEALSTVIAGDESLKPIVAAFLGGLDLDKATADDVRKAFDGVVAVRKAKPVTATSASDANYGKALASTGAVAVSTKLTGRAAMMARMANGGKLPGETNAA